MAVWKRALVPACVAAALIAGCGSSSSSSSKSSSSAPAASSSSGSAAPAISAESFTNDFAAMAALKSLGASGKGKVAAILPDTTSSTRYVEFDQPDLRKALEAAGVPSSDIIIQNAQKSDQTFLTDAQTDITNGATVILSDPEDSGTGAQVEKLAAAHGVKVIDYDRLTLGGSRPYYVSFNNVTVGKVMGQGLQSCVAAWHVAKPQVIVMRGDPTDNNATLFYQGYYNGVLQPMFKAGKWTDVANPAGTWDPPTAATEFEQAYTAHKNANAALIPNDENGAPIITYLKSHGIKPNTFPTTGQDATLTGLQNVLSGYQCGTVYKAIYKEAQAAAALAVYVRAGKTPPSSLLNGTTTDINEKKAVPSVLLTPQWVTTKNMSTTVVKDKFVPTSQLCSAQYASACKKAGIS
ncbi:MAG: D-xylose transport system substrate-binding protein [Solirubrobacteraceae bacterium]|jgi:D-xylose transport system substrate-binding protein|nr:D-xylose transport system substrate-binding protein [Solirubrobacteraceae bacterium]